MKRAKLLLCCLAAAIICFALPPAKGYTFAESKSAVYARADAADIYFCREMDLSTALFAVPYTYCVQIISSEGEWYFVRYADDAGEYRAVEGYCLKENLTPVDEPPENIYLHMTVPLNLSPYAPSGGSFPVSNTLTVSAAFYGSYYMGGAEYSCLAYGDGFYYQLGVDDYPLNEIPAPPESPTPKSKSSNAKLIIALALCALAAAALIILYLTGRKKRFARTDA